MLWYFEDGSERRREVLHLTGQGTDEERWIINCGACGENFTLRPEHGVSFGPDGAMTTAHSFVCPACKQWHRTARVGALT